MKKELDELLCNIKFTEEMRTATWNKIKQLERENKIGIKKKDAKEKVISFAVIMCICILVIAPVSFASGIIPNWMEKISVFLEPVNKTSVQDDIELKVIGAIADNDSAKIYFTLQDLREERITKETSIDKYSLSRAQTMGCYLVDFDENSKIATFCLEGNSGSEMKGKKLTLSLNSFQTKRQTKIDYPVDINIYEFLKKQQEENKIPTLIKREHAYENWNAQNTKGANIQDKTNRENKILLLPNGEEEIKIQGIDWMTVTNITYKDGWLHIQVKKDLEKGKINYGYLYLANTDGEQLDYAILNKPFVEGGVEEFIIHIDSIEKLKNMKLMAYLTNSETLSLVEGNWKTTFQLKGLETKSIHCNIESGVSTITKIEVSSVGITVYAVTKDREGSSLEKDRGLSDLSRMKVLVKTKDGQLIEMENSNTSSVEDSIILKYENRIGFSSISEIASIMIDGQEITIG